jgi:hypothetical protein
LGIIILEDLKKKKKNLQCFQWDVSENWMGRTALLIEIWLLGLQFCWLAFFCILFASLRDGRCLELAWGMGFYLVLQSLLSLVSPDLDFTV